MNDIDLKKNPILLSPAGDFDTAVKVLEAGADAVYAAGQRFGARALASNLNEDEIKEIIDICTLNGKKLYLTVNTLMRDDEINDMLFFLEPLYVHGLHGVIVQDLGAAMEIKEHFPQMSLHSSTQLGVYSAKGVRFLEERGFDLAVLPRELSVEEIALISKESSIALECFIHGALCFCYSGRCLMSSIIGARSGNRGYCAQPCRLPYTPVIDGKAGEKGYPLSLKDLCGYDYVSKLIQVGVCVFKIEGRMKSAEYAAGVTAVYRNLLDGKGDRKSDIKKLLELGNRSGFTNGYLKGSTESMVSFNSPSHSSDKEKGDARTYTQRDLNIPVTMEYSAFANKHTTLTVSALGQSLSKTGDIAQNAKNNPMKKQDISKKLSKTGGSGFKADEIIVHTDEASFIPVSSVNEIRREALKALKELILKKNRRSMVNPGCFGKYSKDKFDIKKLESNISGLLVAVNNDYQLNEVLKDKNPSAIIIDCHGFNDFEALKDIVSKIENAKKKAVFAMPYVFRSQSLSEYEKNFDLISKAGFSGYLVRCIDEIEFLKEKDPAAFIIADESLYTWNAAARNTYIKSGVNMLCVPCELNLKQLKQRGIAGDIISIYGRYNLMITAQCIYKNTSGKCAKTTLKTKDSRKAFYLKDRKGKDFPVKTLCDIGANIIYNSVPVCLFEELNKGFLKDGIFRIDFTDESPDEIKTVLEAFSKGVNPLPEGGYTYGHYKRGVS